MKFLPIFFAILCCLDLSAQETRTSTEYTDWEVQINNGLAIAKKGEFLRAEQYLDSIAAVIRDSLGGDHPLLGLDYHYAGLVRHYQGHYQEAIQYYEKACGIWDGLEPYPPKRSSTINNLAAAYFSLGNFPKAEPLYREALQDLEIRGDRGSITYATIEDNLGIVYKELGRFEDAIFMTSDALQIRNKLLGTDHVEYLRNKINLANIFRDQGNYRQAETLLLEVKEVYQEKGTPQTKDLAYAWTSLGNLYYKIGFYDLAERYMVEVTRVIQSLFGDTHLEYGIALKNLGSFYQGIGLSSKSEAAFRKALDVMRADRNQLSIHYAITLSEMTKSLVESGDPLAALSGLKLAGQIMDTLGVSGTAERAGIWINLGEIYLSMSDLDSATVAAQKGVAIFEDVLHDTIHEFYLNGLHTLSKIGFKQGNIQEVRELVGRMGIAVQSHYQPLHRIYRIWLADNVKLALLAGEEEQIGPLLKAFILNGRQQIEQGFQYLSSNELESYLLSFSNDLDLLLNYLTSTGRQEDDGLTRLAAEMTSYYKGVLDRSVTAFQNRINSDSTNAQLLESLRLLHRQKDRLSFSGNISAQVIRLAEKIDSLEKRINLSMQGEAFSSKTFDVHEIQNRLQPGEAVVDFVSYRNDENQPDEREYLAFVTRYDQSEPEWIRIGPESAILQMVSGGQASSGENIYTRGLVPAAPGSWVGLYDLIWRPLLPSLAGIHKLYLSPEGILHRINFNALPVSGDLILGDEIEIWRLSSSQKVGQLPDLGLTNDKVVLIGGLTFYSHSQNGSSTLSDVHANPYSWPSLPGTAIEVKQIAKIFNGQGRQSSMLTRDMAKESDLIREIDSGTAFSVIHIATHGFAIDPVRTENQRSSNERDEPYHGNPMASSGLLLSGGGDAWNAYSGLGVPGGDGILTALEISHHHLNGHPLVVLSACETGLGRIGGREGVFGLQRAFRQAGARAILMSLWSVPDHHTQEMMVQFYHFLLVENLPIPTAFRHAQAVMRDRYDSPYYWAGFILQI